VERRRPLERDDPAVVVRLPVPPSAESLAEVHAEAIIRASARRWVKEGQPAAAQRISRRNLVATTVAALAVIGIAVVPAVLDSRSTPLPHTVWQHAASSSTMWDPWRDPMRDR